MLDRRTASVGALSSSVTVEKRDGDGMIKVKSSPSAAETCAEDVEPAEKVSSFVIESFVRAGYSEVLDFVYVSREEEIGRLAPLDLIKSYMNVSERVELRIILTQTTSSSSPTLRSKEHRAAEINRQYSHLIVETSCGIPYWRLTSTYRTENVSPNVRKTMSVLLSKFPYQSRMYGPSIRAALAVIQMFKLSSDSVDIMLYLQ